MTTIIWSASTISVLHSIQRKNNKKTKPKFTSMPALCTWHFWNMPLNSWPLRYFVKVAHRHHLPHLFGSVTLTNVTLNWPTGVLRRFPGAAVSLRPGRYTVAGGKRKNKTVSWQNHKSLNLFLTMLARPSISNSLLCSFLCQNTPSLHDWTEKGDGFVICETLSNQM